MATIGDRAARNAGTSALGGDGFPCGQDSPDIGFRPGEGNRFSPAEPAGFIPQIVPVLRLDIRLEKGCRHGDALFPSQGAQAFRSQQSINLGFRHHA